MRKTLHQLETRLERLGGDSDHQDAAILALRDPIETLIGSPVEEEVHSILTGVVSEMDNGQQLTGEQKASPHSDRFRHLQEKYASTIDHHPKIALQIGRIADAFATLGL